MTKTWLVVLFLIGGQPAVIPGFYPFELPDEEACQAALGKAQEYLAGLDGLPPYLVDCIADDAEQAKALHQRLREANGLE